MEQEKLCPPKLHLAAQEVLLGSGVDLVQIPDFIVQLRQTGSVFATAFSAAEWRIARRRAKITGNLPEYHLAARWAGKEAFLKAWSQLWCGSVPVIAAEKVQFFEIEVLADAYARPLLVLSGEIERLFFESVAEFLHFLPVQGTQKSAVKFHLSLSHDGEYAIAYLNLVAALEKSIFAQ